MQTFPATLDLPAIALDRDSHQRTVNLVLGVRLGSSHEFPGTFGIAHLLEHMMFRGNKAKNSFYKLSQAFMDLGGRVNAQTTPDYTLYFATVLPEYLLPMMQVLMEMIKQPLFAMDQIKLEKGAVLNEIKTALSQPRVLLTNNVLEPHLLIDYPEYHSAFGFEQDVQNATLQDVLDLYQFGYTDPLRTVICVHGNFTLSFSDLHTSLVKLWNSIPYQFELNPTQNLFRPPSLLLTLQDYVQNLPGDTLDPHYPDLVVRKQVSEYYLELGWLCPPYGSFATYVLEWISAYLTNHFLSVLNIKLRAETGYVYSVHSEQTNYKSISTFILNWQLREKKHIPITLKIIEDQITQLKSFDKEDELTRWKKFVIQNMRMNQDRSESITQKYGKQMLLLQRVIPFEKEIEIFESISVQEIQRVACMVFQTHGVLAILTP